MKLAKTNDRGQITIPAEVRKMLLLRAGDKVAFIEEDARIVLRNATRMALPEIQEKMGGEADGVGVSSEHDVKTLMKQISLGKGV